MNFDTGTCNHCGKSGADTVSGLDGSLYHERCLDWKYQSIASRETKPSQFNGSKVNA